MPFVSNRVNFSRLSAMAMYPIPKINAIAFQFEVGRILDGRNAGQSTTLMFALLSTASAT
jgi:hypothetical protein